MEALEYLKAKTGDERDNVLNSCILDAESEVLGYINATEVPEELTHIVRKLSLWYYNRLGIEGMKSFSEGGTSQSIDTLSDIDLTALNRFRVFKVVSLGSENHELEDKQEES